MFPLIRHLRAARLFLRCQPYVELPGAGWTPTDAAEWLAFRRTPAGRKLGLLLANQVTRAAVTATADATDPARAAHACGYASGIRGTVTILDSLLPARFAPPTQSPPQAAPGQFPATSPQASDPSAEAPPFAPSDGHALAHLQP